MKSALSRACGGLAGGLVPQDAESPLGRNDGDNAPAPAPPPAVPLRPTVADRDCCTCRECVIAAERLLSLRVEVLDRLATAVPYRYE